MELNKVYLGDCIELMKQLDNNSIDCIITDPPYGDNLPYGRRHQKGIVNNENPLLNCQVIWEAQRLLKDNSALYNFTNWKHYPFLTEFVLRYTEFKIKNMIVCNKNKFGFGEAFRSQHELILVLEKGKPEYHTKNFSNVIPFKCYEQTDSMHPHIKPFGVIRKILRHSTKEGDVVLDCFAGSGNILVACKQLNRNFIGFEILPRWVDECNKKLSQDTLFNGKNPIFGEKSPKFTHENDFKPTSAPKIKFKYKTL